MHHLPLNRAQRALWYAQEMLGPDVPLSIAQCFEITGPVDVDAVVASVDDAARDLGMSTARFVMSGGEPGMVVDAPAEPVTELIDLRDRRDPRQTAEQWMAANTTAPFSLDGPLVRCALIDIGSDRRLLYACAHHILLDGYAAGLLIRHVARRYQSRTPRDATADGQSVRDVPPPARGIDAILELEDGYRGSAREARDRDFWHTAIAELPAPLRIGDHGAAATTVRHMAGAELSDARLDGVRSTAERTGVPEVAVLVAAAARALGRLRRRAAVPMTLVTSTRTNAAVRAAAGTMSNLLPVAIGDPDDTTLGNHLRNVATTLSAALRHQLYRYESMLADAGRIGGGSGPALPPHLGPVLNIVPAAPSVSLVAGLDGHLRVLSTGPVSDLNVNIYPGRYGGLRLEVETNANALDQRATAEIFDSMTRCLDSLIAAEPDTVLRALPAIEPPPSLRSARAGTGASLADGYWRHRASSSTAIVDGERTVSYRALADLAAGLVAVLRHRAPRGATIAVHCSRSTESVVASWAVAAAGMCVLPIDPALPRLRKLAIIEDARPALVLGSGRDRAGADDIPVDLDITDVESLDGEAVELVRTSAQTPAYVLYTSGSTGVPKGVLVPHAGLDELMAEIARSYEMGPDSVVAHFASPGFDTALVEMLAAAYSGATLAVVPTDVRGGTELADFLTAHGVTHLLITPAALATLPIDSATRLSHLIVGGDVCPAPLIRRWAARASVRCAYGPTETTCSVMLTDRLVPDDRDASCRWARR